MRILLAQNAPYFSHGGGDISNRLLMEALAARGHTCRAVAVGEGPRSEYAGVDVNLFPRANLRSCFAVQVREFRPDVILTSTDDPAQILLEVALRAETARVVYLVRATLAVPFGPDAAFPSEVQTARIRSAGRVVGVSRYVAGYIRRHAGIDAVHVPISLLEPGPTPPALGCFENEFILLVNPCAVKGISIFLALADAFSGTSFAAVPTWGTTARDRADLQARPNIRLLEPVDDINLLLGRTRVLLVPSLWAEARSRIILEAMLRGVPVIAADVGGIPEAKMGVPYLLPVDPIARYAPQLDERMVPIPEVPPQDIAPWSEALARLLRDRPHYEEISRASRAAALGYASTLSVEPFERLLEETPKTAHGIRAPARSEALSPEKRRLLALRLRKRAPAASWFPKADSAAGLRVFWFPHAGGGAVRPESLAHATICPVRLPGRESRLTEAPFEAMSSLVAALAVAIEPYLAQPFAFFGHSMGAAVAFELSRLLRERGRPLPAMLIASAARAPQFRRGHVPPPAPGDSQLIEELRRLESMPPEVLNDAVTMRAILPALKADASLYRDYVYTEGEPLPCPIRAYGGVDDPNIRPEHLKAWAEQTTASFRVRYFPGGHFYLHSARAAVLAALDDDLEAAL